jgi:hypothetical protein
MNTTHNAGVIIATLLDNDAYQTTKYIAPNQVMRATRRVWKRKIDRRDRRIELVVTIGAPNYREREFIKVLKKAGEPFPVKKVQIRFMPKPRVKRSK